MSLPVEHKPLDMHVHIVGNGSSGSGCWIKLSGWNRVLSRLMLKTLGLPQAALKGDFDRLYVQALLNHARSSSLGGAVILANDRVYDEHGRMLEGKGSFYVPNEYVLYLAKEHSEFIPAISIHPARADALDELDKCAEKGAAMIKLLPNCHNVDCENPRYKSFWRKLAHYKIPFLAHTGGELTVQVINRSYQNPVYLRGPLNEGVTVIAAHAASASYPFDKNYFDVLLKMMAEYPNLYADNSALNTPFRSKVYAQCLEEPMLSRLVHGSDMPVPVSPMYARLRGLLSSAQASECKKTPSLLERDILIKRHIGFPDSVFNRGWGLIRR